MKQCTRCDIERATIMGGRPKEETSAPVGSTCARPVQQLVMAAHTRQQQHQPRRKEKKNSTFSGDF